MLQVGPGLSAAWIATSETGLNCNNRTVGEPSPFEAESARQIGRSGLNIISRVVSLVDLVTHCQRSQNANWQGYSSRIWWLAFVLGARGKLVRAVLPVICR